ncbi:MAG: hypothetical protein GYA41_08275 [Bacteroidales bacterium]|nr:hypothetical protein [Bacteroidales bacterium]
MKASLLLKVFLLLPLILLVDYILMALFGCTTCLFGLGDEFYCGPFCLVGKIILALSALFFGYLIYPNIKAFFYSKKNGPSS